MILPSEPALVGLALALGAERGPLTPGEAAVAASAEPPSRSLVARATSAIARGEDPLGDALCALRSPAARRPLGATYTPPEIVSAMTAWAAARKPARVVDPGAGSGRFLVAAGRALAEAELVAVEIDPTAAILARANLAAAGLDHRASVVVGDYRGVKLPPVDGATVFLGNPPYVRHHGIPARWKRWLARAAGRLGLDASQLAGLHAHFFLATALHAKPGDAGVLVTSSEWLDVRYGALVRKLLLGPLGGQSVDVLAPTALPFPDADTTAAIACFVAGELPRALRLREVASAQQVAPLGGGRSIARARLDAADRWSPLLRPVRRRPRGLVELGELCRVHRGQVTGANRVWIAGAHSEGLPARLLVATITRARELFAAGDAILDSRSLRCVIDLPVDLDELSTGERAAVERFLRVARAMGADRGFIAEHRKAWWSVGLRAPAPIVATYMARRPPAFVRNLAGARLLNIAHGIYPRAPMSDAALDRLARHLAQQTTTRDGRTYAGGLTKFEPGEMERLLVPEPAT